MDYSIMLLIAIPVIYVVVTAAEHFFPSKRGPRTLNRFNEFLIFALMSSFYTIPAAYVVGRVSGSGALALISYIGLTVWADRAFNRNT